jgi:hypothetical protein
MILIAPSVTTGKASEILSRLGRQKLKRSRAHTAGTFGGRSAWFASPVPLAPWATGLAPVHLGGTAALFAKEAFPTR